MPQERSQSVLYAENAFRYYIIPPVFLTFFSIIVQWLVVAGRGETFSGKAVANLGGNTTSWLWVAVIYSWAYASLIITKKTALGPVTPFGHRPEYKDQGFQYYLITMAVFLLSHIVWPGLSMSIYNNMPEIVGTFNTTAFVLCTYLWFKGKYAPEFDQDIQPSKPVLYEFYRGLELNPKLFGVDVKQFTNCRVGLMVWPIFVMAFYIAGCQLNGVRPGETANMVIQTVYLAKFYWWEVGYFYTIDMMLDRAGYYLCWGCLVLIPSLYTFSSYFAVHYPSTISYPAGCFLLILGLISTALNYRIDYEKQEFRKSKDFKIWGKPARYIIAEYTDSNGKTAKSTLLTSGFWGWCRHMNYTFELLAAWSWCAAVGLRNAYLPYAYFIFLLGLLLHRLLRDEDKCSKKYGKYWEEYCRQVPYRLIPFVW